MVTDWLDNPESGKFFLRKSGTKIYNKTGKIQQVNLQNGDSKKWDITTLGLILKSQPFCQNK